MTQAFAFILVFLFGTQQLAAERLPVTVFAAASLGGVLQAAAENYEGDVTFSFGGSGVMARQIAAGAPADLIILADPVWMTWLMNQGQLKADTFITLATNQLVMIGPADAAALKPQDILRRLGNGRLAMGQRDAVPAGGYAKDWLVSAELWAALAPRLAETDNVRAALALVARGQTPLGIVYATDAIAEPRVQVVYHIPSTSHAQITYPAAALTPAGADFLEHLKHPSTATVFANFGFGPAAP